VARVLICEPHADISALLELVVRRLGHEPVAYAGGDLDHIGVDAAVIEPGVEAGLRVARRLRAQNVPVLFTSIYPADAEMLELSPAALPGEAVPALCARAPLGGALEALTAPAAAAV